MLQNYVNTLSMSFCNYALQIISSHNWSKHHNCGRISCHVYLLSTRQGLVSNQYYIDTDLHWHSAPWDSVHFPCQSEGAANCKQIQYFVAFYRHAAWNTEENRETYSKQHCGILQVTYCSFSRKPTLLLYYLLHTSLCMSWCVFRWLYWSNDVLHMSQQNGPSPLCICWCLFRWLW
jgi:hypothetical protein